MSRIQFGTTILALSSFPLGAQTSPEMPDMAALNDAYGKVVSEYANLETLHAADYEDFARQTLALGQMSKQTGQPVVESSVYDALLASELGQKANPLSTDWETLRNELNALLEPPPEQDQEQQDQENQDQEQNQENEQNSDSKDQEQSESGEQDESEKEGEQNDQDSEGEQGQQDESSQDQQDGQQQSENAPPKDTQNLGEMEQPEGDVELDRQPPPPTPEQMQQIGGSEQSESQEPLDAQMAMALQQLEKIKQQDDPGKLHMLLQEAEGDKEQKPTSTKDW